MSRVFAKWNRTCCVPPHPRLREKWAKERDAARAAGNELEVARKPRRLGFDDGVIIPPESFPLGTPIETIASAAANRGIRPGTMEPAFAPLRGTVNVIVVLVEFSDKKIATPAKHFEDLFFSTGVIGTGSVREFYSEVTNGLISIAGAVAGPYTMPQTLAWYANNNYGIGKGGGVFRSPQLALDAVKEADPSVNFAPYDNDGNGYVDAFIVVHAGPGGEVTGNKGDIWSHKSTLASAYAADGAQVYGYLTIPEDAKVGVSAHELGHLLFGFPDLYDIDYTSEGIGDWCLMAGGSWNGGGDRPAHPSAWCKANQGWATVTNVTSNGTYTFPAVETGHQIFRLWRDGSQSSEYFLVENRQKNGFDDHLPGTGLLAWHIDDVKPTNSDETHYKVALLQADGRRDLELRNNQGDANDPYPGGSNVRSLSNTTTPNTQSYAKQNTCVSLTNVSPSAHSMTATVTVKCGKAVAKDQKDRKDLKDTHKDLKDSHKDTHKDSHKELKEGLKELNKDGKEFKEITKEFKDRKEMFETMMPVGGVQECDCAGLEARVSALEAALGGDRPFIGSEQRPRLIGAPPGPSMSKSELDSPPRKP